MPASPKLFRFVARGKRVGSHQAEDFEIARIMQAGAVYAAHGCQVHRAADRESWGHCAVLREAMSMSDKAARLMVAGLFAIAAAIMLGQGVYAVAPLGSAPAVAVVNKLTGTVRVCRLGLCVPSENEWTVKEIN